MIECIYCKNQLPKPPANDWDNLITVRCTRCGLRTPTGLEDKVRRYWEDYIPRNYPKVTAARAIGLSNAIYATAEQGSNVIRMTKTRSHVKRTLEERGFRTRGIVDHVLIKGRSHGGYIDTTTVGAVVVVDSGRGSPRHSIYVVFRGSRGSIMAMNDPSVNVDWRANFDNAMAYTDYAGSAIRVHGGFKQSLGSYRRRMRLALDAALDRYPDSHVVITGHSQGAGHALLFTHWMSYTHWIRPFCIPFSPPRVGNWAFARDFTNRVSRRGVTLPFDGNKHGAYLMAKGEDPVVFGMEHAFYGASQEQTNKYADSQSIVKQGIFALWSEWRRSDPSDIYFHPKFLTHISSWTPKLGLIKAIDHDPNLFRDKILDSLD